MKKFRAVCFDLGETLIRYTGVSLSWQSLYKNALEEVANCCSYPMTPKALEKAEDILGKYNTRINPRIKEVSADQIMKEVLSAWKLPGTHLQQAKQAFFSFFQQEMITYDDTTPMLQYLNSKSLKIGILTDVPYGMDKSYVEHDLRDIYKYIDCLVTSRDTGYRKPEPRGYIYLAKQLGVVPEETIFVGNEEKDIVGADAAGMFSVLIDRENTNKTYGEKLKISSLMQIEHILKP